MARVCVVGAGISGLAGARTFLDRGHDVVVYARAPDLGGVRGRRAAISR